MQKKAHPIPAEAQNTLRGSYFSIAKKHRVSSVYVSLISRGKRNTNTQLSKKILKDLKKILEVLQPSVNKDTKSS